MQEISDADAVPLKKRKLLQQERWKTYKLSKGAKFSLQQKKVATDLTANLLQK